MNYEVVFRGKIVEGRTVEGVREALTQLMHADDSQVATWFSGQDVILRGGMSEKQAKLLQQDLLGVGAVCEVLPDGLDVVTLGSAQAGNGMVATDSATNDLAIWWIIRGAERRGPYTRKELSELSERGEMNGGDMIWKAGLKQPLALKALLRLVSAPNGNIPVSARGQSSSGAPPPRVTSLIKAAAVLLVFTVIYMGYIQWRQHKIGRSDLVGDGTPVALSVTSGEDIQKSVRQGQALRYAYSPTLLPDANGNMQAAWLTDPHDPRPYGGQFNPSPFVNISHFGADGLWSTPVQTAAPKDMVNAVTSKIFLDAAGDAIVVWRVYSEIFASRLLHGGTQWSTSTMLDMTNQGGATTPVLSYTTLHNGLVPVGPIKPRVLAADANGNLTVLWVLHDVLYGGRYLAAQGQWTATEKIAGPSDLTGLSAEVGQEYAGSWYSAIGEDSSGKITVIYSQLHARGSPDLKATSFISASNNWSPTVNVLDHVGGSPPVIAADKDGNLTYVWLDNVSDDGDASHQDNIKTHAVVRALRYFANINAWSSPAEVARPPGEGYQAIGFVKWEGPFLAVDGLGSATVAWIHGKEIFASQSNVKTNEWSRPILVATGGGFTNLNLVADRLGNVTAVWTKDDSQLFASRHRNGAGAWTKPILLVREHIQPVDSVVLSIDATDTVTVAWTDKGDDSSSLLIHPAQIFRALRLKK